MTSYSVPWPKAQMSNAEKERAALAAAMDYLSPGQRKTLLAIRDKSPKQVYRSVSFCCMIAGVRGYWPVRALARAVLVKAFPGKFELKEQK